MDYPPSLMLTRFAPSPTGLLHIGHAYAAAQVFEMAERLGGTTLLRIEDIDHTRCKTQFSYDLQDDLAWLGFDCLSLQPLAYRAKIRRANLFAETPLPFGNGKTL